MDELQRAQPADLATHTVKWFRAYFATPEVCCGFTRGGCKPGISSVQTNPLPRKLVAVGPYQLIFRVRKSQDSPVKFSPGHVLIELLGGNLPECAARSSHELNGGKNVLDMGNQ